MHDDSNRLVEYYFQNRSLQRAIPSLVPIIPLLSLSISYPESFTKSCRTRYAIAYGKGYEIAAGAPASSSIIIGPSHIVHSRGTSCGQRLDNNRRITALRGVLDAIIGQVIRLFETLPGTR